MNHSIEYYLKELTNLGKTQQNLAEMLASELKTENGNRILLQPLVEDMLLKQGKSPREIATILGKELQSLSVLEKEKEWVEQFLTETEMQRFYELVEDIRKQDITGIMSFDFTVLGYIDEVTERYKKELREYKEDEKDVHMINDIKVNFHRMGISGNAKRIQVWLMKRLLNEISNRKIEALLEHIETK